MFYRTFMKQVVRDKHRPTADYVNPLKRKINRIIT